MADEKPWWEPERPEEPSGMSEEELRRLFGPAPLPAPGDPNRSTIIKAPGGVKLSKTMLEEVIIPMLVSGASLRDAAYKAGLTVETLRKYMQYGEQGHPDYIYIYQAVTTAMEAYAFNVAEQARILAAERLRRSSRINDLTFKSLEKELEHQGEAEVLYDDDGNAVGTHTRGLPWNVVAQLHKWSADEQRTELGQPSTISKMQKTEDVNVNLGADAPMIDILRKAQEYDRQRAAIDVTPEQSE